MSDYQGNDLFHVDYDVKATFEVNMPLTAEVIEKIEEAIYSALHEVRNWNENERYGNLLVNVRQTEIRYNPMLFLENQDTL